MICKKCNVLTITKTLCDDNEGIFTCPNCNARIYLNDTKPDVKDMVYDYNIFIFVDGNYADAENFSCTLDRIEKTMRDYANEHYGDNNEDTSFKIVLVNLGKDQSTIYDYQCEKTVNISCTVY